MRKELWELGIGVAWLLGLPLTLAIAQSFAHDQWILQKGWQQYAWGALAAAVWYAGLWLCWPRFGQLHTSKLLPLLLVLVSVIVWYGGYLVLCALNSIADDSPAQLVDVKLVGHFKQGVIFAATSGEASGVEFECSSSCWGPIGVGQHRLLLRRGRLGLFWGQLERTDARDG